MPTHIQFRTRKKLEETAGVLLGYRASFITTRGNHPRHLMEIRNPGGEGMLADGGIGLHNYRPLNKPIAWDSNPGLVCVLFPAAQHPNLPTQKWQIGRKRT